MKMKKIKYILSLINTRSIKKDEVIRTEDRNREYVTYIHLYIVIF